MPRKIHADTRLITKFVQNNRKQMPLFSIHAFFPFGRLLRFVIGLAVFVQLCVITYNHYSGYYVLSDGNHFLLRMFRGTVLSTFSGFLIAYPDLYMIRFLNKHFSWASHAFMRSLLAFAYTVMIALLVSTTATLLVNLVNPYTEDLTNVLINNALIYSVVNLLLMAVFEAWLYFDESRQARLFAENLQHELTQIRFEMLKSQINPHFMFNSLNVLSGLLEKDTAKAQQFIDEFSQIYRYVLESIEQPVATLEQEIEFMRSYLFLQQIRYGDSLSYTLNISAELLNHVLPPLSLQLVLENAIKHNIINESKPLQIELYCEGHELIVRNSLQPKISAGRSTGLGIKNLSKRYGMISNMKPAFHVDATHYTARLPLINPDLYESFDY